MTKDYDAIILCDGCGEETILGDTHEHDEFNLCFDCHTKAQREEQRDREHELSMLPTRNDEPRWRR